MSFQKNKTGVLNGPVLEIFGKILLEPVIVFFNPVIRVFSLNGGKEMNHFCNVPTCRSQDPKDCDGCTGRDPVYRFVKIGGIIAEIEDDQILSYKVMPIFGTLESNVVSKSACELIKNETLIHAILALKKFDNKNHITNHTNLKRYEVTIGISTESYLSCGTQCQHLEAKPNDSAKCLLFSETVGSSSSPCRCRPCEKLVTALSRQQ
jgi:hypothetical protein